MSDHYVAPPPPPGSTAYTAPPPPPGSTEAPQQGQGAIQSLIARDAPDPSARDPNAPDPVGMAAGLIHGAAALPQEGARLLQHLGIPLHSGQGIGRFYVPRAISRGQEQLGERAGQSTAGQVGDVLGNIVPFVFQPELSLPKVAATAPRVARVARGVGNEAIDILGRGTMPSVLQPTDPKDPDYWGAKRRAAEWGTGIMGVLRGVGGLAGRLLSHFEASDQAARKATQEAAEAKRVAQTQKTWTAEKDAADKVEAARVATERTQRIQQAVNSMNLRGQRDYQPQLREFERTRLEHAQTVEEATAKQKAVPEQTTRGVYQYVQGLMKQAGFDDFKAPASLDFRTAAKTQQEVGQRLASIYDKMHFDPNEAGWLPNAQAIRDQISQALRNSPLLQDQWNEIFADKAIIPAFHTEAGALPGATGIGGTLASETSRVMPGAPPVTQMRNVPMQQGPMGARSGPITGQQLNDFVSKLSAFANKYGRLSQDNVPEAGLYRRMAQGLHDLSDSVQQQIDGRDPELGAQRQAASTAYRVASRLEDTSKATRRGVFKPSEIINSFEQAEGQTFYARDTKLADLRDKLDAAHAAHTADMPTPPDIAEPRQPVTVKGPGAVQPQTAPTRPMYGPRTPQQAAIDAMKDRLRQRAMQQGREPMLRPSPFDTPPRDLPFSPMPPPSRPASGATSAIAAHALSHAGPDPVSRHAIRRMVHDYGPEIAELLARGLRPAPGAGAPASAVAGHIVNRQDQP